MHPFPYVHAFGVQLLLLIEAESLAKKWLLPSESSSLITQTKYSREVCIIIFLFAFPARCPYKR